MEHLASLLLQSSANDGPGLCRGRCRAPRRGPTASRSWFRASGPCWEKLRPNAKSIPRSSVRDWDEGANWFPEAPARTWLRDIAASSESPACGESHASLERSARACLQEKTGLQCSRGLPPHARPPEPLRESLCARRDRRDHGGKCNTHSNPGKGW